MLATSENDKQRAFSLRHRVFCEELGFFSLNLVDRIEQDAFDAGSLHCLIEHRATGLTIGCLRVVIADSEGSEHLVLPAQRQCQAQGVPISLEGKGASRERLCEISRIAIPRYFRTGGRDAKDATELEKQIYAQHYPQLFAMMGVALNLCATSLSGLLERYHVLAMVEPRFHRLLTRVGLRFEQVSGYVDYYGSRATYYIDQRRAERELSETLRPLYDGINETLYHQFHPEMAEWIGLSAG